MAKLDQDVAVKSADKNSDYWNMILNGRYERFGWRSHCPIQCCYPDTEENLEHFRQKFIPPTSKI
jgi:hypothetical protein